MSRRVVIRRLQSDLDAQQPERKPAPAVTPQQQQEYGSAAAVDFSSASREELQRAAKSAGISGRQSNEALREALEQHYR
jgi:hypothetical protein